jgi:hypothetical protein
MARPKQIESKLIRKLCFKAEDTSGEVSDTARFGHSQTHAFSLVFSYSF